MPNVTKTRLNPKKKSRVFFVNSFLVSKVYAKYAGSIAIVHGSRKLRIPPRNAMRNVTFSAKNCAWLWLYSIIFCMPVGSSRPKANGKAKINNNIKIKENFILLGFCCFRLLKLHYFPAGDVPVITAHDGNISEYISPIRLNSSYLPPYCCQCRI